MSRSHHWITPCGGYALRLTAASWQQMDRECGRAEALETGGILVGHYTTDESTAVVAEALPPPKDSTRGRSWFRRGVAGLRGLLAKRWESQVRTYYVGEWHYHPASIVEPSGDDLVQMYGISADPRYRCREPIMLIVGQARDGDERPVRAFVFPQPEGHLEFEQRRGDAGPVSK
ncbi:MAG: Mov34/MPN/PAD-1 family protein [Gemmatimonadetes bacterium]|nr:Mov34/MPN/PAD-1 family protein [Deltaproteobacteria bacterium]MBT8478120.1 Mov34/MPN/PAD-1 family protein [Gemmatimonadota bacterium]NNE17704.1 Mov34/MPN/PAD-1 family protein [Myxococcales bacterium]